MFSLKPTKKNILIAATGATIITGSVAAFAFAPRATTDTNVQRQEFDSFVAEKDNKDMEQDQKIEELASSSSESSVEVSSSSVVSQPTQPVQSPSNNTATSQPTTAVQPKPVSSQPTEAPVSSAPAKKWATNWYREALLVKVSPAGYNVLYSVVDKIEEKNPTCTMERRLLPDATPDQDRNFNSPWEFRVVCPTKAELKIAMRDLTTSENGFQEI